MKNTAQKLSFLLILTTFSSIGFFIFFFPIKSYAAGQSSWLVFQHDAQHTGRSQYIVPETIEEDWTYEIANVGSNSNVITSQPVIGKEGVIYLGIGEAGTNSWGKIYALSQEGTKKWVFNLNSFPNNLAIAKDGKTIYVSTANKEVYAITSRGREKWKFSDEDLGWVSGITAGADNNIYFTDYLRLYSLDSKGNLNWKKTGVHRGGTAKGGPAIASDGTIYVVWTGFRNLQDEQRGELYAFSPEDGASKWAKPLQFAASAPTVGTNGNIYVVVGTRGYFGTSRQLYAFGPNGLKLWQSGSEYGALYAPLITSDNNIIIADKWSRVAGMSWGTYVWQPMSQVKAFSPRGDLLWTLGPEESSSIDAQPILDANNTLFVKKTLYEYWTGTVWDTNSYRPIGQKLYSINSNKEIKEIMDISGSFLSSPVIGLDGRFYTILKEKKEQGFSVKLYSFVSNVTQSRSWSFNRDFQYNSGSGYKGAGHLEGKTVLFNNGSLSLEGKVTLNGSLPSAIPNVYLIATDGEDKELSQKVVNPDSFSYTQISPNTYQISALLPGVIKPVNGGHYELLFSINNNPFFVLTHSLINNHYFRLTEEIPEGYTFNVAVILGETNNVSHISSPINARPCKLIPEKTYSNGRDKEYYQDLAYCLTDYYKENSFGRVNLKFTIYDNNGEWFKTDKNEEDYLGEEDEFVKDAINSAKNSGVNLSGRDIVIVLHSGTSYQKRKGNKIATRTWTPNEQPLGYLPYKIIAAEDDLTGGWAHEIGHIIGALMTPRGTIIPDLYKMGLSAGWVENIMREGEWDLMARGSWNENGNNPSNMSSFTKEFLGWLNYDIHPKSAYGEYWINSLETSDYGGKVFRYNLCDNTQENCSKYYILEARNKNLKTWDSSLPKDKALILYKVDTKGLPEYGYVPKGINKYQEGMMWNQYRKINIPYYDGVLTPDGDSHLDMANLIYISALSDEQLKDKYKIKSKIEKVNYSFFKDRFSGIVLEPTYQLYRKVIKYYPFRSPYLIESLPDVENSFENSQIAGSFRFELERRKAFRKQGALIGEQHPKAAMKESIEELLFIISFFILLNLLLVLLAKKIISWIESEQLKKTIQIFLKILRIASIIIFIIIIYLGIFNMKLLLNIYERFIGISTKTNNAGIILNNIERISTSSLKPTALPDLDLHLYCDDGKHIGMNYQTGEYEVQIEGAIVSGDNQDSPEWIFVPKALTNCHYAVSSYDNQKFLEENPEVAQQIEDTSDNYEVYARYIDPETDIYTSDIVSEKIDIGENLEQPVKGTAEVSVLPAVPLSLLGDVNGDCKVNALDLTFVREKLGQEPRDEVNKKADVNQDGKINIQDLITTRNNSGKNCDFSQKFRQIPGDANLDCRVSLFDFFFIRKKFGQKLEIENNWQADVNQDGKIDIADLIFTRKHLGEKCPD